VHFVGLFFLLYLSLWNAPRAEKTRNLGLGGRKIFRGISVTKKRVRGYVSESAV